MAKLDFAIIVSRKDLAGLNIAENLQKMLQFPATIGSSRVDIFFRDKDVIHLENIDREIDADVFVFASRHVSEAKVHSLTVHSLGNWGIAARGGRDRSLVSCPAALMKLCLKILAGKAAAAQLDYEVAQEATHHGPYLKKPAMFIEIGSDEERWRDGQAGKVVAETILDAIRGFNSGKDKEIKAAVGLGGLHYAGSFRKVMLSEDFAVSYACPKHALGLLDEEMLKQAMQKSVPKADSVIVDWKGLGKEKERVKHLLQSLGISYSRTSDF